MRGRGLDCEAGRHRRRLEQQWLQANMMLQMHTVLESNTVLPTDSLC